MLIESMTIEQTLLLEIEDSKKWLNTHGINICALIETKVNQLIDEINKKDSILESDPLDSEVRILDWILYVVCTDQIKKFERLPDKVK